MALQDVFEAVKADVQAQYPVSDTQANPFEHLLGSEETLAYTGTYPAAVWVIPGDGEVRFSQERLIASNESKQRPLYRMTVPVAIYLWAETAADLEECATEEVNRVGGLIQKYIWTLHRVLSGSFELLSGGWKHPGELTSHGYCFVLRVAFDFVIFKPILTSSQYSTFVITKEVE